MLQRDTAAIPLSQTIRAVLFDLDNTLVPRQRGHLDALVWLLHTYLPAIPGLMRLTGRYVSLDPDAHQLLRTLRETGFPFGIVTNGFGSKHDEIQALGLDRMTSCIFVSRPFGARKPNPSIFLAAASCLDMPAEWVLFVGDALHADMHGAHSAGMKTAWLRRGRNRPDDPPPVDVAIDNVGALTEVLGLADR